MRTLGAINRGLAARAACVVAVVLGLLGVVAAPAAASGPAWLTQQALSSNASAASDVQVGMDNNGDALEAWIRGGTVEYAYRAAGGGSNWSNPVGTISGAGSAANDLHLAMDLNGDAVAAWEDTGDGEVWVASFSTGSETFGTAQAVAGSAANHATSPSVGIYNDNGSNFPENAEIVWLYNDGTNEIVQGRYYELGNPGTFYAIDSLTDDTHPYSTPATNPQVVLDSAGNAVAAWEQSDGTNVLIETEVKPASSSGAFGGYTFVKPISADGSDAGDLRLAADIWVPGLNNAGGVTAVWDDSNDDVNAAYMPIGNSTWNSTQTDFTSGSLPSVAMDGLGNAVAVWVTASNTIDAASLSAGGSQTFGTDSTISASGDSSTDPAVAANNAGQTLAVWQDSTTHQIGGNTANSVGGSFGTPASISSTSTTLGTPAVGIDNVGNGVAGWLQGATAVAQAAGYDEGPQFPNVEIPSSPYAGHAVTFSAQTSDVWSTVSSSSSSNDFAWDFGDGGTAKGNPVSHTYSSTGGRTATLTVTDDAGVMGAVQSQGVTVGTQPAAIPGGLFELDSPNDCFTGASWGCGNVNTSDPTDSAYQPAISPDGKNVYFASLFNSVTEFSRNTTTGALTYMGCFSAAGVGGGCTQITHSGLANPAGVAVSPDGASVYVIGQGDDAIASFTRDATTGALTWQGCVGEAGSSCQNTAGVGLDTPYGVAVSPDGRNVYVTSNGNGGELAEFDRATNGVLTQSEAQNGCIGGSAASGCGVTNATGMTNAVGVAVSPDGNNVYVEAGGTGAQGDVAEFARNASADSLTQLSSPNDCLSGPDGPCNNQSGSAIDGTEDMALSPDGRFAYINSFPTASVAGNNSVVELSRNTSTGALSYVGCVTANSSGCATNNVGGLTGPLGVAISPDGANVYASGAPDNAEASFARDPSTGVLTPLPSPFNCITVYSSAFGCGQTGATGLIGARRVVVSPDDKNVYVAGQGNNAIAELSRSPGAADLAVSVSGAPATVLPGGSFSYTYTVTNNGPASVANPVLTAVLSSKLSGTSMVASQGSCSGNACSLGRILAGSSATVQVPVTAIATGAATTAASVQPSSEVTDPNQSNNSVSSTTSVQTPTATTTATSLPAPVVHKTANAVPVSGRVYVKLPGSSKFIPITQATQLPMGTIIDARHGTVELIFAKKGGGVMVGQYWGGEFYFEQGKNYVVTVFLYGGGFGACKVTKKKHAPIALAARGRSRSLWSNVHGSFTTKGRAASGSVRGTEWLTVDTCPGTRITVTRDKVLVTNLHTHKTHLIHAPHSIFIKF